MSKPAGEYDPKRWRRGIDVSTADNEEIDAFMEWKILVYEREGWRDDNLWEAYRDEFAQFSHETFESANSDLTRRLRSILHANGVLVAETRGLTIAKALYTASQEEEPVEWSEQDIEDQITRGNGLNSYLVNLNQYEQHHSTATPFSILARPIQSPDRQQHPQTAVPGIPPRNHATQGYGRELSNPAKLYSDDIKYSGKDDSLDYKLAIFYDLCDRADVPQGTLVKAFPAMLKDQPLTFFYQTVKPKMTASTALEEIIETIRE